MRVIRVFLSSTFQDFAWERQKVLELVEALNAELAPSFLLDIVDLRHGVTIEGGLDQNTVTVCLREARSCVADGARPAFILLQGQRLGWRPLPTRLGANGFETLQQELSKRAPEAAFALEAWYRRDDNFVERPYRLRVRENEFAAPASWTAVEDTLRAGVNALCGEISEDLRAQFDTPMTELEVRAALAMHEEWPGSFAALRRETDSASPGAWIYTDPESSAARIDDLWHLAERHAGPMSARLRCWAHHDGRFDAEYCAAFSTWISSTLRAVVESARSLKSRPRPVWSVPAVERSAEGQLAGWCEDASGGVRLLYGHSGCGKSVLLHRLVSRLGSASRTRVEAIFVAQLPQRPNAEELFDAIASRVAVNTGSLSRSMATSAADRAATALSGSEGHTLTLCIDAIELASFRDPHVAAAWLPTTIPARLHVVVSTADEAIRTVFETLFGSDVVVDLAEMNDDETRQQLMADMEAVGRRLQPPQLDALVSATANARGRALINRIAAQIGSRMHASAPPAFRRDEVADWIEAWRGDLIVQQHHGAAFLDSVLALLAIARSGLPEHALFQLVSGDVDVLAWFRTAFPFASEGTRLPRTTFSRLLGDISGLLNLEQRDGGRFLSFSHRQLNAGIHRTSSAERFAWARENLAVFAAQGLNGPERDWCLREALYQRLLSGSAAAQLEDLVSDFEFIVAKVSPEHLAATLEEARELEDRAFLESPILEEYVSLLRFARGALEALRDAAERRDFLTQTIAGMLDDNPLRRAVVARLPELLNRRVLRMRFPEPRLRGLTKLAGRYQELDRAQLYDNEIVLECKGGSLSVLDVDFGIEKRTLRGHPRHVLDSLRVSKDLLLTCGAGEVALSSVKAGRDIRRLSAPAGQERPSRPDGAISWNRASMGPDGSIVATSVDGKCIVRWDDEGRVTGHIRVENVQDRGPLYLLHDSNSPTAIDGRALGHALPDFYAADAEAYAFLPNSLFGQRLRGDLLVLGRDRVATIGRLGFAVWSFTEGSAVLLLRYSPKTGQLPHRVFGGEAGVLVVTTAGEVQVLNLESLTFGIYQEAGQPLPGDTRGRSGGITELGIGLYLVWALRGPRRAEARILAPGTFGWSPPLELTCEGDLADVGFFRGGLSNVARGLVPTRRGALAWSAYGNSHIDLTTGVVTALPRWERPTPAASAVALDVDFALIVRNGRAGVIHSETGEEVADFTHWLGDIRAVRALAPGRLVVLDGEDNALFWDVERSGNDFARASALAALRPFRATAAATLAGKITLIRSSILYRESEFELWSLDENAFIRTLERHSVGTGLDHQSGVGTLGFAAVTWGANSKVRIADSKVITEFSVGGLSRIDLCTVLDQPELPQLFCVGPEGLYTIFPRNDAVIPLFPPGKLADGTVRRVVRTSENVYVWTATTLWRYQLGPEDSDFVPLTSVRDLVPEEAGWTIFPNRLSTQLRRFESTHGPVLAAMIVAELAQRVAGDDHERATDVVIEDDVADDASLDLRDAFVSESSEGLIAAVALSRKADGRRFRSTLVVLIDAKDALVSTASFPGLEPRLSVDEGIVMEGADAEPVLVGRAPSGASLALLPIPPRLTQSRVVRGDHFPIRPHARYELTLPLRAAAPAVTLTLRPEAILVTVDGRTASWFAPGGYRVLDVDTAQLRLSVLTHAAEYQVLDLSEAETATRWEARLAYVELLTALGDVERAGLEAEHELLAPRSNGEHDLFHEANWAIALAATLVAAEQRADADALIRRTAEFIQQQFSGSQRAMLLSRIQRVAFRRDIRIGQERVDMLLQQLAAVPGTEDRAALYYDLVVAAFESCRKGAPWMEQVQRIHNTVASELNQLADEHLHSAIRVLAYMIQLMTSRAERVASAEFVPSPVPESLKPMLERALAGDADANSNLGAAFGKGEDVRRSPRDAVYWYERAVTLGSTMAAYNLGAMYLRGEGIEPDKVRAFARMLFAAERGHREAATTVGVMFLDGEGVERDLERAVHWLSVGVERGDELANKNLAQLYIQGVGVLRDCAKARELIGDLVRRGDPQAMLLLRRIHEIDC